MLINQDETGFELVTAQLVAVLHFVVVIEEK